MHNLDYARVSTALVQTSTNALILRVKSLCNSEDVSLCISATRETAMSWGLLILVCICSLLNIQYDIYRVSTVVGLLPHTQNYVCSLFLDVFTFLCVFSVGVCIGKPYCIYVHVSFMF